MRLRRIQLVGLAAAVLGATANGASAEDVTISTATTTPVSTSDPNAAAPVAAGDVTVANGGSITVTAGQTAVTVDSSNDVTVASGGSLASTGANGTTGILILGGATGNISNAGTISLLEDYTRTDSDSDGDPDGAFAQGSSRFGIVLQSGALTGDISNSGTISVEGNGSGGIALNGLLTGNFSHTGSIAVTGDNSTGVLIGGGAAGGVTGNVISRGTINVVGVGSRGLVVNGEIDGALRINGAISTTGFSFTAPPADTSHLDGDDLGLGGSAIEIHYNVANGVIIEGIGVEDDVDDDGDGVTEAAGDTDDDASAAIVSRGSAPALLIQADPSADLTLGPIATGVAAGYGLHVRGSVTAAGLYDGVNSTAIRIQGAGGRTVDTSNGIALDNTVRATAVEANAQAVVIGADATVPTVLVRKDVTVSIGSDSAPHDATAILFASGANGGAIVNSGLIFAQAVGEDNNAIAIRDLSDSVSTITNSGAIRAQVIPTDDDTTDNIPAPPVAGDQIAIDLSASTIDVTLTQQADVVFNDDDTVDGDAATRPAIAIEGDILFGAGADTFNLLAGTATGDLSFGGGADIFNINNGATFTGRLSDSNGALAINVTDGTLAHAGGQTNITSATFGADSILRVHLSTNPAETTFINASGTVTFAAGAQLIPVVPVGLPNSGSQTILTAGTLVGGANVEQVLSGAGIPYLYNISIDAVGNSINAIYQMKTTTELGLTANQTAAFTPLITALQSDDDAAAAFAGLDTQGEFLTSYTNLMPSYASAATELAATAIQQMQSATTNRMANTRLQGLNEVSVWAQEIGYGLERTPPNANGQEFRGTGFGFAVGIDGPLDNGALFGLSASFLASQAEEPVRPDGEISSWFGQANAYLGTAMGPVDLDFVVGAGGGKMSSRRFIEVGSFNALSEADWWGYEGHGAARASVPLSLSEHFIVTPRAALTYVFLGEQGYEESGAGSLDIEADDATSQRLWGDLGVDFAARWSTRNGGSMSPHIYLGYRANVIDEGAERTFRYVGGSDFTLTDEPLGDGGPLAGLGFDFSNGFSTISIGYEGEFGDQIDRHSLNAAVRVRF
ncbi:MAG: autotransporter domain-containing protein [Hyphomonadaceae bacterium]|nr:autotransporter domain-containing protein [Hyphomonadaceae bacterium]